MKKKILLSLLSIAIILVACEKEVQVELPEPQQKYVVEGWIEQEQVATVTITRNQSYFEKVDTNTLKNLFITNARVFVSNGVEEEELKLDFTNALLGIWPPICYKGQNLKGEFGKQYYLKILIDGDTITGRTTIPFPVKLDSIWWKPEKAKGDTLGAIWAIYTDDPNRREFFRLFTKRLHRDKKFIPIWGSVYEDVYFSGKSLSFNMYRGFEYVYDENVIRQDPERFYFKKGDTVDVKVTCIDQEHYNFWRTLEQEKFSGGNPFTYPTLIKHNVKGALGVFGGYAATYYRLVIK